MNLLRGENVYLTEFKTIKEKWSRDHSESKAEGYVRRLLLWKKGSEDRDKISIQGPRMGQRTHLVAGSNFT